jgi:ABC-type amino acid transport substrate-binding protein
VRLDAPQLLAEINTALTEWLDNGFFDDLDRRWFSTISP